MALDAYTLDAALTRLSRAALEGLVRESVRTRQPIDPAALAPPKPPRRAATERDGDPPLADADVGLFRWLNLDVLELLAKEHLTAAERLVFTTRVCKSFRSLVPWTSLTLVDGAHCRTRRTRETLWLVPGGFDARLFAFVRAHASTLTRLSLNLRESPPDVRDIAKLVAAAPNVTDLSLSDKRMQASVMKALAALPHMRKLKRFKLGYDASTKPDAVKLLGGMSKLEDLYLQVELSAESFFRVCEAWRKARNGGAPLLDRLTLGWRAWGTLLPTLATSCPDLRELTMDVDFYRLGEGLALPRGLRALTVTLTGHDNSDHPKHQWSMGWQYRHADNGAIVKRLLAACPALQSATICWHKVCGRPMDRAVKESFALGDALSAVPASLRTLTLGNMRIDDAGVAPLAKAPSTLNALRLCECVVHGDLEALRRDAGVRVVFGALPTPPS